MWTMFYKLELFVMPATSTSRVSSNDRFSRHRCFGTCDGLWKSPVSGGECRYGPMATADLIAD